MNDMGEITVNANAAKLYGTVKVVVKGMKRAKRRFRIGAMIIRFGALVAGLNSVEFHARPPKPVVYNLSDLLPDEEGDASE